MPALQEYYKLTLSEIILLIHCPNCGETYCTAKTLRETEDVRKRRGIMVLRQVEVVQFAD